MGRPGQPPTPPAAPVGAPAVPGEGAADGGVPAGPGTRRTGRNVLAVLAGEVLGKVATLAFTVIAARELGVTGFGSLNYAIAFALLLGTFVTWGFDPELIRRGAGDRGVLGAALGQVLVLRSLHAVPVLVAGGLLGALTRPDPDAYAALLLVSVAAVVDSYGEAGRSAMTAIEEAGRSSIALVGQRVAACVLALGVFAAGGGLVAVSWAYLASSVLGLALLAVLLARRGVRPRLRPWDRGGLRGLWRATLYLGLETVLAMALFRVDALMLGVLTSDAEVARYAVGYRLMETVLFVTWAVLRPLVPAMVRAGGGPALLRVAETALALSAALLVPYGVLLLLEGGELIALLFGSGYGAQAATALRLLAVAPVLFAVAHLGAYVLFVERRTALVLAITAVTAGANAALNLAVIPLLGARGAALATTVSYLLQGAVTLVAIARSAGWWRLDRALGLAVVASLPMAGALLATDLPVWAEAALGGAVYAAAYLLLARWCAPQVLVSLRAVARRG